MKKNDLINRLLVCSLLTLVACKGVFILDPIEPRLPKYTENGYDVAGAFINNEIWSSVVFYGFLKTSDKPYIIVSAIKDSLTICFDGENNYQNNIIEFHLVGLNIRKFDDLTLLKNKKIQLDGVKNMGVFRKNYLPYSPNSEGTGGIGQIYIKQVAFNDLLDNVILSGTFGFAINNSASGTTEVSYGRFDYTINKNSNFRIEYTK